MHNAPPRICASSTSKAQLASTGRNGAEPRRVIIETKQAVQIADMAAGRSRHRRLAKLGGGARRCLTVPMLKEDELVGAIGIYRQEVRPFTDKQIELVRTSPPRR